MTNYRILTVCSSWDSAAESHGCCALKSENIIGTNLLHHISGDTTRMWIATMIDSALQFLVNRNLHYRCDTPSKKVCCFMLIQPTFKNKAIITHKTVSVEEKKCNVNFVTDKSHLTPFLRCSVCNSVKVGQDWIDLSETNVARDLKVIYTLCPECNEATRESLQLSYSE